MSPLSTTNKNLLTVRSLANVSLHWQPCGDGSSAPPQWPVNPDPIVPEPVELAPEYPEEETPGDLPPLEPETGA